MLSHLEIRNFALIDRLSLPFGSGLNVLTGETGVGKSLLLHALTFLLGAKASPNLVRTGERETTVSGLFHAGDPGVREELAAMLPQGGEDADFLLVRSYDAAGSNRCTINGQVVTVAMLRRAGESLIDIHGQHEHQSLLRSATQIDILDAYGKLRDRRAAYQDAYRALLDLRRELDALRSADRRDGERLESVRALIEEIDRVGLQPGEWDQLGQDRRRLTHAEKLAERAGSAVRELQDGEGSVLERLRVGLAQLRRAAELDGSLGPVLEALESAAAGIGEAARDLDRYVEGLAFDPVRTRDVEERHFAVQRLLARHGPTEEQVRQRREELGRELAQEEAGVERLQALAERERELVAEALGRGRELSRARAQRSDRLRKAVEEELRELAMPHARFSVELTPAGVEEAGLTASGLERAEFLFSPNPGEALLPLRKAASGGELARFMLAIKKVLAEADRVPILVFDEVDANVGGRLGSVLGEKLLTIAARRQVLCVSHMAQIAAYADRHVKVHKRVENGGTFTEFVALEGRERVEEIAEMVKGRPPTPTTIRQAEEMLSDADRLRRRLGRKKTQG